MNQIETILQKYNRPCQVLAVHNAPQCWRVKLSPLRRKLVRDGDGKATGETTRISHLASLAPDIAAQLGVSSVLVSRNGGIWIEIAKTKPELVLATTLQPPPWHVVPVVLGKDTDNQVTSIDLAHPTTPHVLIAGTTGSGKSVLLKSIVLSLAKQPEKVVFSVIDPHGECNVWKNAYGASTVTDSHDDAMTVLRGAKTLAVKLLNSPSTPAHYVIVVDEFANLLSGENGKEIEQIVTWLLANGRKAHIHLVMATQYPGYKVCQGVMKANFPVRVCMRVMSKSDSWVALGENGAEKLMGNGDGYLKTAGELTRFQGAWVEETDVMSVPQKPAPRKSAAPVQKVQKGVPRWWEFWK